MQDERINTYSKAKDFKIQGAKRDLNKWHLISIKERSRREINSHEYINTHTQVLKLF
jgi:hypothetical protein